MIECAEIKMGPVAPIRHAPGQPLMNKKKKKKGSEKKIFHKNLLKEKRLEKTRQINAMIRMSYLFLQDAYFSITWYTLIQ